MALLGNAHYHDVIRAYNDAFALANAGQFARAYERSNEGIQSLAKVREWPFVKRYYRETIEGYLYFFRANSYQHIHAPGRAIAELKDNKLQVVLSDYSKAIDALIEAHSKQDVGNLLLESINEVAILCSCNPNVGKPEAKKAIDYCDVAMQLLGAMGDEFGKANMLFLQSCVHSHRFEDEKHHVETGIDGLLKTLPVFQAGENKHFLFNAELNLCLTYHKPVFAASAYHFEQTIYWAKKAIAHGIELQAPHLEMGLLYYEVGSAFLYRVFGDYGRNCRSAFQPFEDAFAYFGEQLNGPMWPELVFDWIRVLKELNIVEQRLSDAERRLEVIFSSLKPEDDPQTWFDALSMKRFIAGYVKSSYHQNGWSYRKALKDLEPVIKRRRFPKLWTDLKLSLINEDYRRNDKDVVRECLGRYQEVAQLSDLSQRPDMHFYTHTRIAVCHVDLGQWQDAAKYLDQATANLIDDIENRYSDASRMKYRIPVVDFEMRLLPYVPLMVGDIEKTLVRFDYIYSRALAYDLEILDLIDQQINREALIELYIKVKQHEFVLPMSDSEQRPSMLEFLTTANKRLDTLRANAKSITRREFFSDLEPHLKQLDCWTLLPVLSNDNLRLALIPPRATLKDVYVSETKPVGFNQELVFSDYMEWAEGNDQHDQSFLTVCTHLWANYIGWVIDILNDAGIKEDERISLNIIATGPITRFPFAMAISTSNEKMLIDSADISYTPSLYVLFSLNQRAKRFKDSINMAFIAGAEDEKIQNIEMEHLHVKQLFENSDHSLSFVPGENVTFENAEEACRYANHWHITTHGKYDGNNINDSYITIGGEELPLDILTALVAKRNFRLAIAAACQTGLNQFITEGYDPEGFLYKFLEIGAIGAIGVQWVQNDAAASLLTSRFYDYYVRENFAPAKALAHAQIWLRNAKAKDLISYVEKILGQQASRDTNEMLSNLYSCSTDYQPFEHPQFWAGFMLVGQ